jgi:hypothetical protein
MSRLALGASAQATDVTVKITMPRPSARLAPIRSERFPANSKRHANRSVYASMIHCWPVVPPPRSDRIRASATFTIPMSRVIRKNPIEAMVMTIRECGALGRPSSAPRSSSSTSPSIASGSTPSPSSAAVCGSRSFGGMDVTLGELPQAWGPLS